MPPRFVCTIRVIFSIYYKQFEFVLYLFIYSSSNCTYNSGSNNKAAAAVLRAIVHIIAKATVVDGNIRMKVLKQQSQLSN